MAKSKLIGANEKIAEKVVDTYKKIADMEPVNGQDEQCIRAAVDSPARLYW